MSGKILRNAWVRGSNPLCAPIQSARLGAAGGERIAAAKDAH